MRHPSVRALASAIIVLAGVQSLPVLALDAASGKVREVHVTEAGNLPFRVLLQGNPILCTGGTPDGYLDDADQNYKVFVSALLMATTADNRAV
jgi:hypothetical protein